MPPTERLSVQPQLSAAGQAELTTRQHRLSQRHRTVLFLVDGRRSEEHVRALAAQAGAGMQCLDDLVQLGLVVRPGDARQDTGSGNESSLLPSSQSLQGESTWAVADDDRAAPTDRPLAEARELLLRSVRQEAPVAGALTLMKLKRASSREDLEALLDEVEQRLRKPHRQIIAAQTLRHVRHLLGLPTASRPS